MRSTLRLAVAAMIAVLAIPWAYLGVVTDVGAVGAPAFAATRAASRPPTSILREL